jgi:hypothetical protein
MSEVDIDDQDVDPVIPVRKGAIFPNGNAWDDNDDDLFEDEDDIEDDEEDMSIIDSMDIQLGDDPVAPPLDPELAGLGLEQIGEPDLELAD